MFSRQKMIKDIIRILLILFIGWYFHIPAAAQTPDDLVFVHHYCGANWLSNSLNTALLAKDYIDERNDIYYGTTMSPDPGRPISLGGAPGDNTNMNH